MPPGGRPDQSNLLGPTNGPPSGFQPTPQGGLAPTPGGPESLEYKEAAAQAVAPDKTVRPMSDPAERAKYGIAPGDTTPYQVNADGRVEAVPGSAGGNRAREDVTKGINEDIRGSYQKAQGAVGTNGAAGTNGARPRHPHTHDIRSTSATRRRSPSITRRSGHACRAAS